MTSWRVSTSAGRSAGWRAQTPRRRASLDVMRPHSVRRSCKSLNKTSLSLPRHALRNFPTGATEPGRPGPDGASTYRPDCRRITVVDHRVVNVMVFAI